MSLQQVSAARSLTFSQHPGIRIVADQHLNTRFFLISLSVF